MDALSQIVGTFIGFATVMLTTSLLVYMIVRSWQYLSGRRSATVAEMLSALNYGYRSANGDAVRAYDAPANRFVLDLLSDPALHLPDTLRLAALPPNPSDKQRDKRRSSLAKRIEHLDQRMLLDVVKKQCIDDDLPPGWYGALEPEARRFETFETYVTTWFTTAEGATTEQYRRDTRRVAAVFSCVVVVLVNLDGFALVSNLMHSDSMRAELARRAPDVLHTADEAGATGADPFPLSPDREDYLDLKIPVAQLDAILSEPELGFGWTNSWIAKKWCAYQGCGKAATSQSHANAVMPALTGGWDMIWFALRWLLGLGFSCVMVSLGAPFWAERLKSLLNLKNAVSEHSEDAKPS